MQPQQMSPPLGRVQDVIIIGGVAIVGLLVINHFFMRKRA